MANKQDACCYVAQASRLLVFAFNRLLQHFTVPDDWHRAIGEFIVGAEPFGPGLTVFDGDTEKASLAAEESVHLRIVARIPAIHMLVVDGATAHLDEARLGVFGAILPMAVAGNDVGVL